MLIFQDHFASRSKNPVLAAQFKYFTAVQRGDGTYLGNINRREKIFIPNLPPKAIRPGELLEIHDFIGGD